MWTRVSSLTLKLKLASSAPSKDKYKLFIAFLSSLERDKPPKNRGKTLNYFPNLASNQKASESSKMQKKINLAREVWHECQAGIWQHGANHMHHIKQCLFIKQIYSTLTWNSAPQRSLTFLIINVNADWVLQIFRLPTIKGHIISQLSIFIGKKVLISTQSLISITNISTILPLSYWFHLVSVSGQILVYSKTNLFKEKKKLVSQILSSNKLSWRSNTQDLGLGLSGSWFKMNVIQVIMICKPSKLRWRVGVDE